VPASSRVRHLMEDDRRDVAPNHRTSPLSSLRHSVRLLRPGGAPGRLESRPHCGSKLTAAWMTVPSSHCRWERRWRPCGEKGPHGIPAAWLHISEEFTPLHGADDEHSHVEQPNDNKMTRESQDELKDAKDAKDATQVQRFPPNLRQNPTCLYLQAWRSFNEEQNVG
jgi:hypothetical protein